MAIDGFFDYKKESIRYDYYYRRLQQFYEKPVTQVSTAVLFTIGTIIFFAVFAIKPTLETISNLLQTIDQQKILLKKAEQKAAALGTAQQQLEQIQTYIPAIDQAIPVRTDIQTLIRQLEALASQDGIPIQSVKVGNIVYPEDISKNSVQEISFTISVSAAYPKDYVFLQDISKLPRLISVEAVNFQPDITVENSTEQIQMSVNCKAYMYPTK